MQEAMVPAAPPEKRLNSFILPADMVRTGTAIGSNTGTAAVEAAAAAATTVLVDAPPDDDDRAIDNPRDGDDRAHSSASAASLAVPDIPRPRLRPLGPRSGSLDEDDAAEADATAVADAAR